MTSSNLGVKRARPAFGTILSMQVFQADDMERAEAVLTRAFALAEELEGIFSKFRPESELNLLNFAPCDVAYPISRDLAEVLLLADRVRQESDGGFNPYTAGTGAIEISQDGSSVCKRGDCRIDLSGIAKGHCVDRLCEYLHSELPDASGVVNAGGDLRFFNHFDQREVALRIPGLGFQRLNVPGDSVATSSFSECRGNPDSSTVYHSSPKRNLRVSDSVTVVAEKCAVADALTKAGWFAEEEALLHCARHFRAQILIFDGEGRERVRYQ